MPPVYDHKSIKHSAKRYVRKEGDFKVHTNTVGSKFSLLKRGIIGTFHQVSKKHPPLYLAEFDHRYNHRKVTDGVRTISALKMAEGKRLTGGVTASRKSITSPVFFMSWRGYARPAKINLRFYFS